MVRWDYNQSVEEHLQKSGLPPFMKDYFKSEGDDMISWLYSIAHVMKFVSEGLGMGTKMEIFEDAENADFCGLTFYSYKGS